MDLTETSATIIELLSNGIMAEDYEIQSQLSDTVTEIKLKAKEDGKQFHILVMESLPEKSGGES